MALLVVVGCREPARTAEWTGTIDTLPNGAVLVRNPATGIWDSASAWRVVEELRIGAAEGAGPEVFGRVDALAVDAYGRIYVLDQQAREIRVFDASGAYVRTIGRAGGGPGEFRQPIALTWDTAGRLWVVDPGNGRYVAFDTTGRPVATGRRPAGGLAVPWPGGFDSQGRLYEIELLPGDPPRPVLLRLDEHFQPTDTLVVPRYEEETFHFRSGTSAYWIRVPFTPRLHWLFDRRGFLWFGITDRYAIYQRRLEGDTLRTLAASLDVFDPEGRYLGQARSNVEIELIYPAPIFRGDHLYTVTRDTLDVPYVVRARIPRGARREASSGPCCREEGRRIFARGKERTHILRGRTL